jgi:hypothetical protein
MAEVVPVARTTMVQPIADIDGSAADETVESVTREVLLT